jgi:hypothetical protein
VTDELSPSPVLTSTNLIPATREALPARVTSVNQLERLAQHACASGMYKRFPNASAAVMVMAMAHEVGLTPAIGLTSIHFYDGKPSMSGNLMWSLVLNAPEYELSQILQRDEKGCRIRWVRSGRVLGESAWTEEDSKRAGLLNKDNWKKYPRAMAFNRAVSEGFKAYAAHLGMGYTIYTPDELGQDIDADGGPVDRPATPMASGPLGRLNAVLKALSWTPEQCLEFLGLTSAAELATVTDDELARLERHVETAQALRA